MMNLAQAYRRLGDDEAALAGFEHYLKIERIRSSTTRWVDLDGPGDLPRAEQLFRRSLELDPNVASAKNALGVVALKKGDLAGAERLIREAIATKADVRLALQSRADRRAAWRRSARRARDASRI